MRARVDRVEAGSLGPAMPADDAPGKHRRPLLDRLWIRPALFGLVALVMRGATFGDPTVWIDEQLYVLIGQKMSEGELPYVDIWDRKPVGLFLLYAAIAGIDRSILAVQIASLLFAAGTAFAQAPAPQQPSKTAGTTVTTPAQKSEVKKAEKKTAKKAKKTKTTKAKKTTKKTAKKPVAKKAPQNSAAVTK